MVMLPDPVSVFSQNGVLHTSLHLVAATHFVEANTGPTIYSPAFEITSRLYNGTFPGPVLYVKPGDQLILDFYNDLGTQGEGRPHVHNDFSSPNESNLHFHGLHVSGELPSDDSTRIVGPGQSYRYITEIPQDHMAGTHFIHPHRHGSTTLQTGGGAVAAIIVEDDPKTSVLPSVILDAEEVVVIIQEMRLSNLKKVARLSGDNGDLLQLNVLESDSNINDNINLNVEKDKFYVANGQLNPTYPLVPNEWIRLRVIHNGWLNSKFYFDLPGCTMKLIAKDGVYLPTLPRSITQAHLVNAGRADIMVRCDFEDDRKEYPLRSNTGNQRPIMTFVKKEEDTTTTTTSDTTIDDNNNIFKNESAVEVTRTTATAATGIPTSEMVFPEYLQDLRGMPVTPGCSCRTVVENLRYPRLEEEQKKMNDDGATITYSNYPEFFYHETYQGAIVERIIDAVDHPYHQHVHPFQIVSESKGNYYQNGDWHDTIDGNVTIRYRPTVFTGKMMIHCHRVNHEDEGQMAMEYIHPAAPPPPPAGNSSDVSNATDAGNNKCYCGPVDVPSSSSFAPDTFTSGKSQLHGILVLAVVNSILQSYY